MKLLTALVLLSITSLAFAGTKGTIVLNGKKQPVTITDKVIVVGTEEFKIIDFSAKKLEGHLEVKLNGKATVDKNVIVIMDKNTVEEIANDLSNLNVENIEEVKCSKSSNAFIMIGDNLNSPFPLIANCLNLK